MNRHLEAPIVKAPSQVWPNHTLPLPPNSSSDPNTQPNPGQLTVIGSGFLPTLGLAPIWAVPPIFRPEHAHRIPFFERVQAIHIGHWRSLSNNIHNNYSATRSVWRYDQLFATADPAHRDVFECWIENRAAPVLYQPRNSLICTNCIRMNRPLVNGVHTSGCYFFLTESPKIDENGICTVEATCVWCLAHGKTCKIKVEQGPTRLRFVIDPKPGAKDYQVIQDAGIEDVEMSESEEAISGSRVEEDGAPEFREQSSDDEFDPVARRRPRVSGKKRKRGSEEQVASRSVRTVSKRPGRNSAEADILEIKEHQWDAMSPNEINALSEYMAQVQDRRKDALRVAQLEQNMEQAAAQLAEKTRRVDELEMEVATLREEAKRHKTQAEAQSSIASRAGSSSDVSSPLKVAMVPQGVLRICLDPSDMLGDRAIPEVGNVAVSQNCAIYPHRDTGKPILVGLFEQQNWMDVCKNSMFGDTRVWQMIQGEGKLHK